MTHPDRPSRGARAPRRADAPSPAPPAPLGRRATLGATFAYVDEVYGVARLAIDVTVRALRRGGVRLVHRPAWDHVARPGKHFLAPGGGCLSQATVAFVPAAATVPPGAARDAASASGSGLEAPLGVLFHLRFTHPGDAHEPTLTAGTLDAAAAFDAIDRRAAGRLVPRAAAGRDGLTARVDGPLLAVRGARAGQFDAAVLFTVPLDHLAGYAALTRAVVRPLAALLARDAPAARAALADVAVVPWPAVERAT